MIAKAALPCAVLWSVLGACMARGDNFPAQAAPHDRTSLPNPAAVENTTNSSLPSAEAAATPQPELLSPSPSPNYEINSTPASMPSDRSTESIAPPARVPPGASSWITSTQPGCCGPMGRDGPIFTELYTTTGLSIPVGGHLLSNMLDAGWDVQAGGRSLFFNTANDKAWTADISLNYIYNHSNNTPVSIISPVASDTGGPAPINITVRDLHRTFANLALGQEWYCWGPANSCGWKWRTGWDIGGRLGTAKSDIVDPTFVFHHLTDTIYGLSFGLHSDLEWPCGGCCTFITGFRAEYDFTWMDILGTPNNSNLMDVNLLLTFGVRF
jgi:hypothetical protein